jgi:ketosteroid isomerase-like protein
MSTTRRPGPAAADRFAIDDLYADYFWALDTQDLPRYLGAFWDDAVLAETQLDETVDTRRGVEEIRAFAESHFGGYAGHQHRESNRLYLPDPSGSPDRWILRSYWFSTHREDTVASFHSTGHSKDIVERRNGEWRFVYRWLQRWPGAVTHPLAEQ